MRGRKLKHVGKLLVQQPRHFTRRGLEFGQKLTNAGVGHPGLGRGHGDGRDRRLGCVDDGQSDRPHTRHGVIAGVGVTGHSCQSDELRQLVHVEVSVVDRVG